MHAYKNGKHDQIAAYTTLNVQVERVHICDICKQDKIEHTAECKITANDQVARESDCRYSPVGNLAQHLVRHVIPVRSHVVRRLHAPDSADLVIRSEENGRGHTRSHNDISVCVTDLYFKLRDF